MLWMNRAQVFSNAGRHRDALASIDRGLALSSHYKAKVRAKFHADRARVLTELGEFQKAEEERQMSRELESSLE